MLTPDQAHAADAISTACLELVNAMNKNEGLTECTRHMRAALHVGLGVGIPVADAMALMHLNSLGGTAGILVRECLRMEIANIDDPIKRVRALMAMTEA